MLCHGALPVLIGVGDMVLVALVSSSLLGLQVKKHIFFFLICNSLLRNINVYILLFLALMFFSL